MDEEQLYPYREPEQAQAGIPPQGTPMQGGYPPQQPQQPYAQPSQYPQPQGAGYWQVPARNGISTAALVTGIVAVLLSLLAYNVPLEGYVIFVIGLAAIVTTLGVVSAVRGKKTGIGTHKGVTGIVLGAASIGLCLVLASTAAGGLDKVFSGESPSDDPITTTDDDDDEDDDEDDDDPASPSVGGQPTTAFHINFEGTSWSGLVTSKQGYVFPIVKFQVGSAFEWIDDSYVLSGSGSGGTATGSYKASFGKSAMSEAESLGFDAQGLLSQWQSEVPLLSEEETVLLVLDATQTDSAIVSEKTAWFGYGSSWEDEDFATLYIMRKGDDTVSFFYRED